MAASISTGSSDFRKHYRGCGGFTELSSSHQKQYQSSMALLYEELSLLRAKYQLLVEQCNSFLKPRTVVEITKRTLTRSKVLKASNVTPPPIEQQRELQLLEDVLEKARKIRISQPMDQPQRVVRTTENAAKIAEAVYKPPKKQSDTQRLPSSRSQGSVKTTLQKRQHTPASVKKHKPPSSSTKKKCHSQAQPQLHTFSSSQLPTVAHLHQAEGGREGRDVLKTLVVRHTEKKKESPQLKPMPMKYRQLQQMVERTNEHFKTKQDSREDESVAEHFFKRFEASSDHSEQFIQLLITREEHKLVALELASLSPHDLIASERQTLEEVVRMRARLEQLTTPLDPPQTAPEVKDKASPQSVCQPYSSLIKCQALLELRLSELWLRFETEIVHYCSQYVLPHLIRMDSHDLQFMSLLNLAHRLCGLSPPVFVSTDVHI